MRLSRKSEYAILALVSLARVEREKSLTINELATQNGIPPKFLEQILIILKRQNWVRSFRGSRGGYQLTMDPKSISLAQVIRLIDGPLAPVDSVSVYFFAHTPSEKNPKLIEVLKEIRDFASAKLEAYSIADLI